MHPVVAERAKKRKPLDPNKVAVARSLIALESHPAWEVFLGILEHERRKHEKALYKDNSGKEYAVGMLAGSMRTLNEVESIMDLARKTIFEAEEKR